MSGASHRKRLAGLFVFFGIFGILGIWASLGSVRVLAASDDPSDSGQDHQDHQDQKKKKIVYRSHTQLDFSGETVQGKVRAPEVFYIFQRKRSEAHHVVQTPLAFDYHASEVQAALEGSLGRSSPK